jgi:hypothetical protein
MLLLCVGVAVLCVKDLWGGPVIQFEDYRNQPGNSASVLAIAVAGIVFSALSIYKSKANPKWNGWSSKGIYQPRQPKMKGYHWRRKRRTAIGFDETF